MGWGGESNQHTGTRGHEYNWLNSSPNNTVVKCLLYRKLNLVDLAGSESVKLNETGGERFKEAKTINTDLLDLGIVIRKIVIMD